MIAKLRNPSAIRPTQPASAVSAPDPLQVHVDCLSTMLKDDEDDKATTNEVIEATKARSVERINAAGARLFRVRRLAGISRATMSTLVGESVVTLQRAERPDTVVSPLSLERQLDLIRRYADVARAIDSGAIHPSAIHQRAKAVESKRFDIRD